MRVLALFGIMALSMLAWGAFVLGIDWVAERLLYRKWDREQRNGDATP